MRRYILSLLATAVALAAGCLSAAPARDPLDLADPPDVLTARRHTFVRAEGTAIVDETGRPLVLRGVNLGNWLSWEGWMWGGGWDSETKILRRMADLVGSEGAEAFRREVWARMVAREDIARVRSMGFNVVRIPLNYRILEPLPDGREAPGWAILDRALDWCEECGVYVVLDLHSAPGGQSMFYYSDPAREPCLWESEACQVRAAALWQAIAARYKNRRIVAGYDLLNEPLPPSGRVLVRLYERIIAAIRQVDPDHMVILEGDGFSRDFSLFAGPLDSNMAYSPHFYTWFGDDRPLWFSQYRGLAARDNVPLWCGEFGENSHLMLRSTVLEFEDPQNRFSGYCFWSWKKTANRWPGLLEIRAGPRWAAVMDWVSGKWFAPRPTPEEAARGVREFLDAIDLNATIEDAEMLELLRPKR